MWISFPSSVTVLYGALLCLQVISKAGTWSPASRVAQSLQTAFFHVSSSRPFAQNHLQFPFQLSSFKKRVFTSFVSLNFALQKIKGKLSIWLAFFQKGIWCHTHKHLRNLVLRFLPFKRERTIIIALRWKCAEERGHRYLFQGGTPPTNWYSV